MNDQDNPEQSANNIDSDVVANVPQEVVEEVRGIGLEPHEQKKVFKVIDRVTSYRGPLPPSEEFARYETVMPGAAERIIACMEQEQRHRHEIDRKSMELTFTSEEKGQEFAFYIMALLILGAMLCAYIGQIAIGLGFLGAASIGAVKKFIDGRVVNKDN